MQVAIKGASFTTSLLLINPDTEVDYVADFIGNAGGLTNGDFVFDHEQDCYVCDRDTLEWWEQVISDQQQLAYRIHDLSRVHGEEPVRAAFAHVSVELADEAAAINSALDDAFGAADN
ncbi:MAG: hypothetical protein Q4A92_11120 [Corynebacterium sp.]|nr:hypothetical protein [Corynebacterium sp.]